MANIPIVLDVPLPVAVSELEYADGLVRPIPGVWTLDVANRSIEETPDWITHNVLQKTFKRFNVERSNVTRRCPRRAGP